MWKETHIPIAPLRIVSDFGDPIGITFSDPSRIGIVDGRIELIPVDGKYSMGWQWADLPRIIDQSLPPSSIGFVSPERIFGWEKLILETSGVNSGDLELWERHHSSYHGSEWTDWKRVGVIVYFNNILYLTHIKTNGDGYDGIQFRIKMRSSDGEYKTKSIDSLELFPILDHRWSTHRYFEPQFPVLVTIVSGKGRSFDLPVISEEDTPRFVFRIQQSNGEFVDLSDVDIFFRAKERYLEDDYIFDKIATVLDAEYGLCEVRLDSDDTQDSGQYISELSCSYGDSGKLVLKTYPLTIRKKI